MSKNLYNNFEEFLKTKDIKVVYSFIEEGSKDAVSENTAEEHLKLISEFHRKTMGFDGVLNNRIDNYTGKNIEEYKVYIKRLKRDLGKLSIDKVCNQVDAFILEQGDKYLERAESSIKQVYEWGYYDIIHRSMKRTEVCLGDSYHDNIRNRDGAIEIIDISHLGYNLVENDCVVYLNKLRKKGVKFDWRKLSSKFCEYEGLDKNSEGFIIAMLSYPHEFMRSINRYRYRSKDWTDEKYMGDLISAVEKEGDSLL